MYVCIYVYIYQVVQKVKDRWDLKNRVFPLVKDVPSEELEKYALQIKIADTKLKRALLKDVNPASRLFLKLQMSSGGPPKNSGYKPIMTELDFSVDTFFPKMIDKLDFVKIELQEKPDSGPGKTLAYYKAPMPRYLEYPVELLKVPLYGSTGFFQGQPVGIMSLCIRSLGQVGARHCLVSRSTCHCLLTRSVRTDRCAFARSGRRPSTTGKRVWATTTTPRPRPRRLPRRTRCSSSPTW